VQEKQNQQSQEEWVCEYLLKIKAHEDSMDKFAGLNSKEEQKA